MRVGDFRADMVLRWVGERFEDELHAKRIAVQALSGAGLRRTWKPHHLLSSPTTCMHVAYDVDAT
jgi:hypothetical protein